MIIKRIYGKGNLDDRTEVITDNVSHYLTASHEGRHFIHDFPNLPKHVIYSHNLWTHGSFVLGNRCLFNVAYSFH